MKQNRLFQKIALSTLLLSAVASPSAFADTSTEAVQAVPAVRISTAMTLDPVKLAETYAPETVSEWKQTMAEYNDALASRVNITSGNIAFVKTMKVDVAGAGQELSSMEPLVIQSIGEASEGKAIALKAVKAMDAVIITDAAIPAERLDAAAEDQVAMSTLKEAATVTVTLAASEGIMPLSAFAQGWAELNNAVNTNDGNAIKQALAHQLALYKQEITTLKEGGLPLAQLNVQAVPAAAAEPTND